MRFVISALLGVLAGAFVAMTIIAMVMFVRDLAIGRNGARTVLFVICAMLGCIVGLAFADSKTPKQKGTP